MNLQERFIEITRLLTDDEALVSACRAEIEKAYSEKHRHYHNLHHLENLFAELETVKANISDWNAICFSVFYHDVIYNARQNDNEEQSAWLAEKHLRKMQAPETLIARCKSQIFATKSHEPSQDDDTNLFTDADLAILGKPWAEYETYCRQIREEYSIYPDLLYRPGRKKVLKRFLEMKRIYKTDLFAGKYEEQARENLRKEKDSL